MRTSSTCAASSVVFAFLGACGDGSGLVASASGTSGGGTMSPGGTGGAGGLSTTPSGGSSVAAGGSSGSSPAAGSGGSSPVAGSGGSSSVAGGGGNANGGSGPAAGAGATIGGSAGSGTAGGGAGGSPLEKDFSVTVGGVQMVLKPIPPGQFTMGGGQYGQLQVKISRGFWMGSTELSQEQYQAIAGNNPAGHQGPKRPVEQVSWTEAMAVPEKLNASEAARLPAGYKFRLPTEAEWEYAARAGHTGDISGTGNMDDMGWYSGNSAGTTHDVGTKMPNEWGLHDMHGNVWEWNFDDVVLHSQGIKYPTSPTPLVDPVSFQPGPGHPYRGGGYHLPASACSAARRDGNSPGTKSDHIGIRLALGPTF